MYHMISHKNVIHKVQQIHKNHCIVLISMLWCCDNKNIQDVLSNIIYRRILEGYGVGQNDPTKINVLDDVNYAILVWTTNVQQETIANYFRYCKNRLGYAISENLNEPTCKNIIHELEVMINDLSYHNKMDVNNLLDYPSESDTCSEV